MISIVIPNFNSGERLAKNLPKLFELLKKSKLEFEVIVVDDASTDNSVEVLEKLIKQKYNGRGVIVWSIGLIKKKKNTGFGMTVDRGIRAAKGEVVFILNAIDILPESSDYFKTMLKHFDNPKVFSVAAVKRDQEDHGHGVLIFTRGLFLHFRSFEDYTVWLSNSSRMLNGYIVKLFKKNRNNLTIQQFNNRISAWADGGAQALRKEYYLKIGGFDSLYKFYWEDVDLGYRAWKAGYKVEYEPGAVLIHQKAEGPIAKFYSERSRRVMNLRNQFIFTWKNADLKYLLRYFLWEPYHATVALKNRDWDFFKAYWQAVFQWPKILLARWRQKKATKLSDDEVLEKF